MSQWVVFCEDIIVKKVSRALGVLSFSVGHTLICSFLQTEISQCSRTFYFLKKIMWSFKHVLSLLQNAFFKKCPCENKAFCFTNVTSYVTFIYEMYIAFYMTF